MSRTTCTICGKKRDSKFMINIPFLLVQALNLQRQSVCERNVRRWGLGKHPCIIKLTDIIEKKQIEINKESNSYLKVLRS